MNNVDTIKRLYKAFSQGDLETIFSLLDPSILWIESEGIPYGGVFKGHDAILEGVFQKIGAEWDAFTANVDQFIDAGNVVVTLGTDSGIYQATGKQMSAPTASVWTLENGKVVEFRQYIDTLAVFNATQ
ncbi:MAG: DUF4440 domain-containing protein [Leptolyngbya sp. SIO3F4]|nr:DUF4440 domain-containing protein [Leptolyngbya sp. SIO3F4]